MNRLIELKERALVFLILFAFACFALSPIAHAQLPVPSQTPTPLARPMANTTPEPLNKFLQRQFGSQGRSPANQPRPTLPPITFHTPIPGPTPMPSLNPIPAPSGTPPPVGLTLQQQVDALKDQVTALQNQLTEYQLNVNGWIIALNKSASQQVQDLVNLQGQLTQFYQEYQNHCHVYEDAGLMMSIASISHIECDSSNSPYCVGGRFPTLTLFLYSNPDNRPNANTNTSGPTQLPQQTGNSQ